ncbi:DUF5676 family membrane protein [Stutzerimonas stutzeri]|uniref:DUF5676 family membrane protein n=1 Tax=Stutzerimonas stutzeri TaxID=316 RepID=UPI002109B0FE|nr:DUF5676 family membrane protein [Stutzerimonas stutzeri]MCQ4322000.1 DUF5676 family membrane protein [Stutzerimonas stutzeri]
MSTDPNQRDRSTAGIGRTPSFPLLQLNPKYLGFAFGATGVVFYLGCMLTMATVPHDKAVVFFNSLLHGLDVGPILKTSVPVSRAALGLATIFILCWFAGVLVAGIYNLGVRPGKQ